MKKTIVFLLLAMSVSLSFAYEPHEVIGRVINLVVAVNYNKPVTNPIPKSPALPPEAPEASIDGHTLYLYDVDYDLTLRLLDEDGEEAYSVSVPANTASVVLPATLTGDYELQLYTDGIYYFTGWVEL